jgi:uncharacterized membrane protein
MSEISALERLRNLKSPRLDAFTDGIFAIIATLLVLTIDVPQDIPSDQVHQLLPNRLLELWPHYTSYIVSFIIICTYWFIHHILFHLIRHMNRLTLCLNLLFLMLIAFIPFISDMMSEYGHHLVTVLVYGGVQVITGGLLAIIWLYCTHMNNFLIDEAPIKIRNQISQALILAPVLNIIATIIAFYSSNCECDSIFGYACGLCLLC